MRRADLYYDPSTGRWQHHTTWKTLLKVFIIFGLGLALAGAVPIEQHWTWYLIALIGVVVVAGVLMVLVNLVRELFSDRDRDI